MVNREKTLQQTIRELFVDLPPQVTSCRGGEPLRVDG